MMSLQLAAQSLSVALKLLNSCGVNCRVEFNSAVIFVRDFDVFSVISGDYIIEADRGNQSFPYTLMKKIDDIKIVYNVYHTEVKQILPQLDGDHNAA